MNIDLDDLVNGIIGFLNDNESIISWVREHWVTLVLTAEIIGAVVAVKYGHYRKGLGWLIAALVTIWMGVCN